MTTSSTGFDREPAGAETIELFRGIVLKPALHCILNGDKLFPLPGKEFEVLMFLLGRRGRFVTTEEILNAIWDEYTTADIVRQYIYKLRKKLKIAGHQSILLYFRGIGYTLAFEQDPVTMRLLEESSGQRRSGEA